MKTLITYVHFENNESVVNLQYFLKIGLTNSTDHHFNFVINSPSGGEKIPVKNNISIIKGHNKGYDFGGYKQSLESVNLEEFERFIFINDTCRGPFLPEYISTRTWIDIIGHHIKDQIKLVGATWNFHGSGGHTGIDNLHIQSYFFATDLQGVNLLLNENIFDTTGKKKMDIINHHEIEMSRLLIKSGFKIKPLQLSQYNGDRHGDICYKQRYYGITLNPFEVMFIKANRLQTNILHNYTQWKIQKADVTND